MKRKALAIAIACVFGSMHALEVNAQEDEFEIMLDAVLEDASEVDGVIMTLIDEEHDEESGERDEFIEDDRESSDSFEHEELVDHDENEADELDDGNFDDYDDGEPIEIPEEEHDEMLELDGQETDESVVEEMEMELETEIETELETEIDEPVVDEPEIV